MAKNMERTWIELLNACMGNKLKPPADCGDNLLWAYVTILRGPDIKESDSHYIKFIFTCPLRGKACLLSCDVNEYLGLKQREIEEGFLAIYKQLDDYRHYLSHIMYAWEYFYPKVANVLRALLEHRDWQEDNIRNLAKEYKQHVDEWLESKEIFMEE